MAYVFWLLYVFSVTAFVGFFSGLILGLLWILRWSLGLEAPIVQPSLRRAARGYGLVVLGLVVGGLVVVGVIAGPFIALVGTIGALFGEYPPDWVELLVFAALVSIALAAATWFARRWQRVVWAQLAAEGD
jgi:xanthosine utilization system XapX-like protein